jgi:hypothetical protein
MSILTGLPIFTKTDKLYSETGWTTLSSRRHNRKLQLFYNIKNGHAPNFLRELIPPTVQSTTIYPLRNGSDLIIPFCRKLVIQLQSLQHLVAIFQVWLNNTLHNYPIFHRHIKKLGGYILSTVFHIKNGHAPNYLRELIPPTIQSTTIYLPLKKRFGFNNTFL